MMANMVLTALSVLILLLSFILPCLLIILWVLMLLLDRFTDSTTNPGWVRLIGGFSIPYN